VEEARVRLTEVLDAEGDVVCAAEAVEGNWGMTALRSLGPQESRVPERWSPSLGSGWRSYQVQQMNLSQASAQMSQALANEQTARANAYLGQPGASAMAYYAMRSFDAAHAAATATLPQSRRRGGGASGIRASISSAQYATVWTEYLKAPAEAEERGALLDWLTTRSMTNLEVLRTYQKDFNRALTRQCR